MRLYLQDEEVFMSSGYSGHSSHNRAQTNDHMWVLIPFLWQHVCTVYSGHMCVLFTLATCVYCTAYNMCVLCTWQHVYCVLYSWPHVCTVYLTTHVYCVPDHMCVICTVTACVYCALWLSALWWVHMYWVTTSSLLWTKPVQYCLQQIKIRPQYPLVSPLYKVAFTS